MRMGWVAVCVFSGVFTTAAQNADARQPNVVMFAVDDMCDWTSPMGYTQAITPNMDRLAARGVTFQNAHTGGVFCAPSRSAIFTGRYPSHTGCYTTQVYFHSRPEITPLQQVLKNDGYATFGAGKLFHHPAGFVDLRGWTEFFVRDPEQKQRGWSLDSWTVDDPILPQPYPNRIYNHDQKPAKYFDLYDRDKIELPPYLDGDLDDLPPAVRAAKTARSAIHRRLESLGAVKDAIHGYLAFISYADAMLGRILDAIDSDPNADNTIVVWWSDHGYHHGEKLDWGKHTLWIPWWRKSW